MAMVGVGWADNLYPLFSYAIFEGFEPDLVFTEDLVKHGVHIHGVPHNGAEVFGKAPQVGYEIFRLAGKLILLVCH
jgi:hypothetical protein